MYNYTELICLSVGLSRVQFLKQLKGLVQQRDAIMADTSLTGQEREARLAQLTLPKLEENLPQSRLEELWYDMI